MVGFGVRRVLYGGAIALAALLLSPAAASAGACDAKNAQALIGKSESPRLEQKALELSGASDVALVGQGIANTADYRTDRVDLFLDRTGIIVGISCG
jgi:hypothetical protein